MKALLLSAMAAAILGCSSQKTIQMSMSDVELVKIDTVQRYPNSEEQILTWRSTDHIEYVTYEPMHVFFTLGSRMKVLTRR